MPSVEGKENVDGQILPGSCAAGGGTAVPAKRSSCGVGPRSGNRKPSHRIAALRCSSSVDSNLQAGVVRAAIASAPAPAPSTSGSAAASAAAAAAGYPAADSAQQSRMLVPTPATTSGKKPASRSSRGIKPPLSSKETADGSASSSVASVMETRKPKRLDMSRKSRGGIVLSAPVPLPCASPSNTGRKKTGKKRSLAMREGVRGQEGRKVPQRRGVEVGRKDRRGKKGKEKGAIKPPSTVPSKPSSPSSQERLHFDFDLDDGEGSDVSTPPAACSGEEAATAVVAKAPQDTAQGFNKKNHKPSSAPVRRGPPPPPPPPPAAAVAMTKQVRPTVARQVVSPKSAGSQSPRGSWHLGALFGESEDEEEARETGLWRLSDDDGDEPDLLPGEEGPAGVRVVKRRRASCSAAGGRGGGGREGGRRLSAGNVDPSGKACSRGKRVSGGGTPRQKRAAAAAAGGSGSGSGSGGGGSGGGGVDSLGDGRRSLTALEPDIACAASPMASTDKAPARRRAGAHPGDPKRQSKGEQQQELEAKELEALRAHFRRVDSHRLSLSR